MMFFRRTLKKRGKTRFFAGAFSEDRAWICRLDKEIESREIFDFWREMGNFPGLYLFTKSMNSCPIFTKKINKKSSYSWAL
jgi:hypothetical protein